MGHSGFMCFWLGVFQSRVIDITGRAGKNGEDDGGESSFCWRTDVMIIHENAVLR